MLLSCACNPGRPSREKIKSTAFVILTQSLCPHSMAVVQSDRLTTASAVGQTRCCTEMYREVVVG